MDGKTPESFGQQHFGGAALGHKAGTKRLVETADRYWRLAPWWHAADQTCRTGGSQGAVNAWSNILRSHMPACWTRM